MIHQQSCPAANVQTGGHPGGHCSCVPINVTPVTPPATDNDPATRAIDFDRCQVCDSMAVVRLPDDWQEQERSIPIIACGNPWHYATRSLGDAALAAERASGGLDVDTVTRIFHELDWWDSKYESRVHGTEWRPVSQAEEFVAMAKRLATPQPGEPE